MICHHTCSSIVNNLKYELALVLNIVYFLYLLYMHHPLVKYLYQIMALQVEWRVAQMSQLQRSGFDSDLWCWLCEACTFSMWLVLQILCPKDTMIDMVVIWLLESASSAWMSGVMVSIGVCMALNSMGRNKCRIPSSTRSFPVYAIYLVYLFVSHFLLVFFSCIFYHFLKPTFIILNKVWAVLIVCEYCIQQNLYQIRTPGLQFHGPLKRFWCPD